jgi:hypothetical protein
MSVQIQELDEGKIVEAEITAKLTKDDFRRFGPEIERLIDKHGKIRVLVQMHDFRGWDAAALWEDIKLDVKHFNDIERIAILGEKKWQERLSMLCRPFTTARVRYFDHSELDQAREWIRL